MVARVLKLPEPETLRALSGPLFACGIGGGHWVHITSLPGESPWTEEPGGLQSMGLQRVRHD